ncbi:MAG: ArnT family glycosyltransferase [Planctomycetota bacterium]|jgi:4-amino-4-deoxy-L-arabinose transferase-like glycosyltransferase
MGLIQSNSKTKTVAVVCGLILISSITAGWKLGARAMDGHECFVSVTARRMLESGDWVVPSYNGQLRLEKTPLNYWLVAMVGKFTGHIDEVAARVPSLVCAIVSSLAIVYFVKQWLGFRTAVISALMWSTSLGFIRYGRSARPEMSLTCFVAIAFLAFFSAIRTTERKRQIVYMLIFWASLAVGMLAKGPAPLPLVFVPLFFYFLVFKEWKTLPKLLPIAGVVIFLLIVLAWPTLLANRLAEAGSETKTLSFWKREFVDRFFGGYGGSSKPSYYYLHVMLQFMLPWSVFVPMALAAPFYKIWDDKQKTMMFLWLWFAGGVVIMSLSSGKRMHYILPAMPAMAILVGILFEDMAFGHDAYTVKYSRNMLLFHVGALTAGAVGIPVYAALQGKHAVAGEAAVISVMTLAIAAIIVSFFAQKRPALGCAAIFVGFCILFMSAYNSLAVVKGKSYYTKKFAVNAAARVPSSDKVIAYKDVSSGFVHYFGRVVPVVHNMPEIYDEYLQGAWIAATGEFMEELTKDSRFAIGWLCADAQMDDGKTVEGALFHKPVRAPEAPSQ